MLKALEDLPSPVRERLDNVDVVVQDWPSQADLEQTGLTKAHELFGIYQGVPLTDRAHYDMVLPDKITIFRRPIEAACGSKGAVVHEIRITVIHEVAHHFGISDGELEQTHYR